MNLGQMLEDSCRRYPDRVAVIHEKTRLTYGDLNRDVNALGIHLQKLGIGKDDKVALMLGNCPEFVISYFAAVRIGAVAVTLNAMSTPYELRHLLCDSDAKVFITAAALAIVATIAACGLHGFALPFPPGAEEFAHDRPEGIPRMRVILPLPQRLRARQRAQDQYPRSKSTSPRSACLA